MEAAGLAGLASDFLAGAGVLAAGVEVESDLVALELSPEPLEESFFAAAL